VTAISNGFSRPGTEHPSASSLNLWATAPAVWLMERLLGRRSPSSALMARGKAVEHGVHAGQMQMQIDKCTERALATYDREMTLNPDERRDSETSDSPARPRSDPVENLRASNSYQAAICGDVCRDPSHGDGRLADKAPGPVRGHPAVGCPRP
jgi:hypothetical protein